MGPLDSPPCITARRGGCVINKCREATEADADGMVFLVVRNRKTTPASRLRTLRDILLIAQPPLLAVVQGGESARPKPLDIIHSSIDRAYNYLSSYCVGRIPFIVADVLEKLCVRH
jgi:hypothetical protein